MIDEMNYSWVNATAVTGEMDQFNNTMKLFMLAHEENHSLLTDTKKVPDSEWYDQLHQKVLSFKHKMA